MQTILTNTFANLSNADLQQLLTEQQQQHLQLSLEHEALTKSHDHYAHIHYYSGIGYLTLDQQGAILNANPAAKQLLGYFNGCLNNKKLADFIYPEDLNDFYLFIQTVTTHQTNQRLSLRLNSPAHTQKLPTTLKTAGMQNNEFTYIECQHTFNKNQANGLQIHLAVHDITEHKTAQEHINFLNEQLNKKVLAQSGELIASSHKLLKKVAELEQSKHLLLEREARLNSIFNAAIEGIITIDAIGNIVAINASVTHIFGYEQQELVGKNFIKLMPQAKTKLYARYFKQHLTLHIPKVAGRITEIKGEHKNGTLIPIDLSVSAFALDNQHYYTGIVRDASLRKAQEQQDKALLDELAHVTRVGLMGEMASGIAHEINQPLSAITSYTQACLNFMQNDPPDLEQLAKILLKTQQQALNAGQIIHRMRDFVKFKTIHRSAVDINNLIQICIDLCGADLKHNNIVQRYELSEDLPPVNIDGVQIQQVLINLIRNAVDALKTLPPTSRRHLSIQSTLNDKQVIEIRVKDNGPGIADPDQKKLLTPFFTTKADGMGMGLSICHSILKAHDGTLHFNSLVNKGTTFYFTLPVRKNHDGYK
ncbi:MAG: PAS domain S-box protein [Methylococcaceae bacterium]|nr:PAS domain S-box protein [Methylococcaceae bacterium]